MDTRKRRYFDVIQSELAQPGSAGDASSAPRHVGDILRRRREELGHSLPDLATNLRIRLPYLEAIEQGRWGDLPGHAYITGFLRTYAGALGLEPGPVMARFKQDTAGTEQAAELYFPEAVDESRVPGGALILLAVLLAGASYAGWYALSSSDRSVVESVQELPSRMAGLIPGGTEPTPAAPEPEPAQVLPPTRVEELIGQSQPTAPEVGASNAPAGPGLPDLPPDAPSASLSAETATRTAAADPVPAEAAADTAGEEEAGVPELPPELSVPLTLDAEGRMVPPSQDAADAGTATAPDTAPTAEPTPVPSPVQTAAAPSPDTTTAPDAEPAGAGDGRVFGQTDGPVRVTVRAVEDSWVEIRDARGTLWAARNLRPGDTFRAPDVPGLTLSVVGNAGGVVLTVDGRDLPALGGRGQVVRDISLVPGDVAERLSRQGGQG